MFLVNYPYPFLPIVTDPPLSLAQPPYQPPETLEKPMTVAIDTVILVVLAAANVLMLLIHTPLVWFFLKLRTQLTGVIDKVNPFTEFVSRVNSVVEPFQALQLRLNSLFDPWTLPNTEEKAESRRRFFSEMSHGALRALKEQAGSAAGVLARQQSAAGIGQLLTGEGGAGALSLIKGKIDLPVVGKVTPAEALQLFQTLRGFMSGGNPLAQLTGAGQTASSSSGQPP